jgi:hypothetical protein
MLFNTFLSQTLGETSLLISQMWRYHFWYSIFNDITHLSIAQTTPGCHKLLKYQQTEGNLGPNLYMYNKWQV